MKRLFIGPHIRASFVVVAAAVLICSLAGCQQSSVEPVAGSASESKPELQPRFTIQTSAINTAFEFIPEWDEPATLQDVARAFEGAAQTGIRRFDKDLAGSTLTSSQRVDLMLAKATLQSYDGDAPGAYATLADCRPVVDADSQLRQKYLGTVIYLQGMTSLRRGETENCIMCRGESSCILPISESARHTVPEGSRLAIRHFTEYLQHFPDDGGVRWLLNLAHMTLGEYPEGVDSRYLVRIDRYLNSEFDIGRFRDIGHRVGLNQFTQAGGAIMDDFDNDGLLDAVISSFDPMQHMQFLRNMGNGKFEDRTEASGLKEQVGGGLNCMQTDFNNDGWLDILVVRGAWLDRQVRPSLLMNNRDGSFTDVTTQAGLQAPVNSIAACWGDYDNDGWLDLLICCELQLSRLYHNEQNGTFRDVTADAGLFDGLVGCKGANWIDFDNDGHPDLLLSVHDDDTGSKLYRNKCDGSFEDVSKAMGIDGPRAGFACWAWDYDNDGWLDIFNTCYTRKLDTMVRGLAGETNPLESNRLYRNQQGQSFQDVTEDAGLDLMFATMGSNFGDFDNDGFLDMYLGTGDPEYETLVPNRMFRNVDGKRFAEITASAGTGNLQKGHGVSCADWDRDGNVDLFVEMGGAVPGDKYHNILFQNPGHSNAWVTVKLVGEKTNKPAIGARIKVVTAGSKPQTVHRHISSGSSFGANPLQQTIGLGAAESIELLEIEWPTSGTTQQFRSVAVNQAIEITEFAKEVRPLNWTRVPLPPER